MTRAIDWYAHGMDWALVDSCDPVGAGDGWTADDIARAFEAGARAAIAAADAALAAPSEPKPDGRLHNDGYFTWTRRDGYVLDRRLPCDFYLAPVALPAAQPVAFSAGMCNQCGKWAGAHATLPGQPRDHLCMCCTAAPQPPAPALPAAQPVAAWCLGNPAYAHSSNIIAAHEFTPDSEHLDEWAPLYAAPAPQAAPQPDCEWTNCPRRTGNVCCNERS